MRIYNQGELVKPRHYTRNGAGKFSSFRTFVRRVVFWFKVSMGVVFAGAFCAFMGAVMFSSTTVQAELAAPQVVDRTPEKIAALKADVVQKISDCERAGHSEDDGIITFDSNAKASIGVLQFQKATVIQYEKQLYGKDISGKEAVEIALDETKAKALATDIVFKVKGGVFNWQHCSDKQGLAPKVEIIKELEK